jgi:hypothetical protein
MAPRTGCRPGRSSASSWSAARPRWPPEPAAPRRFPGWSTRRGSSGSTTLASSERLKWQQVSTKRNRSSRTTDSGGSSRSSDSAIAVASLSERRASRRIRSTAHRLAVRSGGPPGGSDPRRIAGAVTITQARGLSGIPVESPVLSALTMASWRASSASVMSPVRRINVARIRVESSRVGAPSRSVVDRDTHQQPDHRAHLDRAAPRRPAPPRAAPRRPAPPHAAGICGIRAAQVSASSRSAHSSR